jgi:YD repeat-containing protein
LIEQVGDDLEVEVGGPPPVDRDVADRSYLLALRNAPARLQPVERLRAQVPEESKELRSFFRLVSKDNGRTVVERLPVVPETVHGGVERGEHGAAGFQEEVHSQVDRAPLLDLTAWRTKLIRRVEPSGLVVSPHSHPCASGMELAEHDPGQLRLIGWLSHSNELGTCWREIENHDASGREIRLDYTADGRGIGNEPIGHAGAPRIGRHPGCTPEGVIGEAWADVSPPLEGLPGRSLRDGQIGVLGILPSLMRSETDAHREPDRDQVVEQLHLLLRQGMDAVITRHHLGGGGQRIGPTQDGVCRCDRGLDDRCGLNHVTEVDHTTDTSAP